MDENDVRNVSANDLDGKNKKFSFQVNLLAFFEKLFGLFRIGRKRQGNSLGRGKRR